MSELAKLQLEQLLQHEGNKPHEKEIGMVFCGEFKKSSDGKIDIFLVTHLLPCADPERTGITVQQDPNDYILKGFKARDLSKKVLPNPFREAGVNNNGELYFSDPSYFNRHALVHSHPSRLGAQFNTQPSRQDLLQANFTAEEKEYPQNWGIVTKANNLMSLRLFFTVPGRYSPNNRTTTLASALLLRENGNNWIGAENTNFGTQLVRWNI